MDIGKIERSLRCLCACHKIKCSHAAVLSRIAVRLYDQITTGQIVDLTARTAIMMASENSEYERLAVAVTVSRLHKCTGTFSETNQALRAVDVTSKEYNSLVDQYGELLEWHIDYNRDYLLSYAELKAMMASTLAKIDSVIIERPQSSLMRLSLFLNGHNTKEVLSAYQMLSGSHLTVQAPVV